MSARLTVAVKGAIDDEVREIGLRTVSAAINMSPVGNPTLWQRPIAPAGYAGGHFRRNWQVGVGTQPAIELPGEDSSGSATLGTARSAIGKYRGGVMYLVNNVPYANRLDNGHSLQAPGGISRGAVAVGLASLRRRREI